MNLPVTNPLFYPYTILSCLNIELFFVHITNFPLSKFTYYIADGKYKKFFHQIGSIGKVKLIISCILCIFSEDNHHYIIISIINIIFNIKFSHVKQHCLDQYISYILTTKNRKSKKRFIFLQQRGQREAECKPPKEAVEANAVVLEDKIFSQSKCTHQAQMS